MRHYAKFRTVLLSAALLTAIYVAHRAAAQDTSGAGGATATVERINPFSLVVQNMDWVFAIIVLCSIIGVTLIIQGFIKARPSVMIPESTNNRIRDMIAQRQFRELIEFTETDPSFVSKALNPALKRAPNFQAMKEAMETAVGEQTANEFRRIEYLNIIGNLGPLLGLLGTVLGMIEAFGQMSVAGNADPKILAYGISKALCHTMLGLMLALPCLAAFGVLRTLVDRLTVRGALIAEELLLMIKPAEARPAAQATRLPAAPVAVPVPSVGAARRAEPVAAAVPVAQVPAVAPAPAAPAAPATRFQG